MAQSERRKRGKTEREERGRQKQRQGDIEAQTE